MSDLENDPVLNLLGVVEDYEHLNTFDHVSLRTVKRCIGEIQSLQQENQQLRELYNELIYAVAGKFPDETRHETALRYINNAESSDNGSEKALQSNE